MVRTRARAATIQVGEVTSDTEVQGESPTHYDTTEHWDGTVHHTDSEAHPRDTERPSRRRSFSDAGRSSPSLEKVDDLLLQEPVQNTTNVNPPDSPLFSGNPEKESVPEVGQNSSGQKKTASMHTKTSDEESAASIGRTPLDPKISRELGEAEKELDHETKETLKRRQTAVSKKPKEKGKGPDPRNWGNVRFATDEVDINAQRAALASLAAAHQTNQNPGPATGLSNQTPQNRQMISSPDYYKSSWACINLAEIYPIQHSFPKK